jgi:hypothetical protein
VCLHNRRRVELQREVVLVLTFVARSECEPSTFILRSDVDQGSEDDDRVSDASLRIEPVSRRIERLGGARRSAAGMFERFVREASDETPSRAPSG